MKLSVIIPGYNTPDSMWRRCVVSVVNAIKFAGSDAEVICVDDGSRVSSTILDEFARQYPTIRVIRLSENMGQAYARNVALDEAKGEYITFVDSDDEVCVGAYEKAISEIGRTCADICVFGVECIWVQEGLRRKDFLPTKFYGCLSPDDVELFLDHWMMYYPCNKVYSARFLSKDTDSNNLPLRFSVDGMPCEDAMFNLKCVMAGAKWCTVSDVGYVYYRTAGSSLGRYKKTLSNGIRQCAELWKRYREGLPAEYALKFQGLADCSSKRLAMAEWNNIWMPGSPFSLMERWQWLKTHPEVGGGRTFVLKCLKMFFRNHCYIRPIRRWHLRRIYERLEDYK